jgi:hypothetical protein
MTLVDSSAWNDFFRCRNLPHVTRLKGIRDHFATEKHGKTRKNSGIEVSFRG